MQRLPLLVLLIFGLAAPHPSAPGADSPSSTLTELKLVAYGILQKQKTGSDGPSYVLVDKTGKTTYALAPAGDVPLESHVGKQVEVVGKFDSGAAGDKRILLAEAVAPTKTMPPAHFVETQSIVARDKPATAAPEIRTYQAPATVTGPPLIGPDGAEIVGLEDPSVLDPEIGLLEGEEAYAGRRSWRVRPCGPPERIWARGEYLLWWTKGLDLPPLVTTNPNPATPKAQAGVLGVTGTQVVFGNDEVFEFARHGGRVRLGGWIGQNRVLGMEVEYTALADKHWDPLAVSNGQDILARPFFNTDRDHATAGEQPGQDSDLVSYPNEIVGLVGINVSSEFRSAGVRLLGNVLCNHGGTGLPEDIAYSYQGFRVDVVGGYRYIGLLEQIQVYDVRTASVTPQVGYNIYDRFRTQNSFDGGELGLLGTWRQTRWWAEGLFKVAVGRTDERVAINGATEETIGGGAGVPGGVTTQYAGGLLALATNIGQYKRQDFAWAPELGLTLGYRLTPHLNATAGYTFLYLSRVVRPNQVVDLTVNDTFIPGPGPAPGGEPYPRFAFSNTSYWAQGFNLGLDCRW